MDARQTISAVAARTGFSASALRYYEDAGLLTPDRTDAGYRVYDDRTVGRIRFISRAKQLGLSLDEITELVALWDGDHCSPVVAYRLRDLVEEKIRETQHRIAELIGFTADLQRARAGLLVAGNDPCGDTCACHTERAPSAVGVALTPKPNDAEAPVIACTLAADESVERVEDWRKLLARATGRTEVENGLVVHFPPDSGLAADVATLATAETL